MLEVIEILNAQIFCEHQGCGVERVFIRLQLPTSTNPQTSPNSKSLSQKIFHSILNSQAPKIAERLTPTSTPHPW